MENLEDGGCLSTSAACHGKDKKLEMKVESATENFCGIDMNSPQPVCSPRKSTAPEPESSAIQENSTAMKHTIRAWDMLQENVDSDGLTSKSACHSTVSTSPANKKDPKRSYHTHDDSVIETIDLRSVEEIISEKKLHSRKPFPLLDLNVKIKDSTSLAVQPPFNEAQQCQLRTQILVYGSLIEGALPSEALMGVAFADISKVTRVELWEDYFKDSKSSWEKVWQTTAMRLQRNATIVGTSWPLNQNASSIPFTSSSKSAVTSPNMIPLTPNNDPFAFLPTFSKNRGSREGNIRKNISRGTKSPHVNNSALPSAFYNPTSVSNCTPSNWNMPLSGKQVTQNFQGPGNRLGSWEASGRPLTYSQHGSVPAPSVSAPWVSPYSTSEQWVAPTIATGLHGSALSETLSGPVPFNGHMGFQYPPYGPIMPIVHPLACSFTATPASNLVAVNAVTVKDKGEAKRSEKLDSKTKRRKEVGFNKETLRSSSAQLSADNSSNLSVRLNNYVMNMMPMTTTPSTQPAISTTLEENLEREVTATTLRSASNDRGTVIPVSSSLAIPTSFLNNLIVAQEVDTAKELSSQSTTSFLEQAKLSAQEAAHFATLALEHSQTIWDQIKHSKLDGDGQEAQVAYSATAVAAGASVAKAAAAAAKLAYEAAAQAAALINDSVNPTSGMIVEAGSMINGASSDVLNSVEGEKEKDPDGRWQLSSSSTSILSAAKEKVKKQILSAAAATKRAQNLETAVQAAELAVEAAWQVGAVVAMGDPVPITLQALKDAGMENYWKIGLTELEKEFGHMHASSARKTSAKIFSKDYAQETGGKGCSRKATVKVAKGKETLNKKSLRAGKVAIKKKLPKRKKEIGEYKVDRKTQNPKTVKDVQANEQVDLSPAKVFSGDSQLFYPTKQVDLNLEPDKIVEGSVVEVVPDEEGLQGVWFSAKVLSVKDNQISVLYDELLADDGNGKLQEWIPFSATDAPSQNPPRVRLAHPFLKDEASRKRKRSAFANSSWMVGDHVDAWMRDGWWEGVVTSRSEEDETKVTVYFPGDGDIRVVKSWNLRPSLVWKDGSWVPYSDGLKEANRRENQSLEVNAAFPDDGDLKNNTTSSSKDRILNPSSVLTNVICARELPSVSFDADNASKKRKYMAIGKKTRKDGNLLNIARKLEEAPKAANFIPLGHGKSGKAKMPDWQSMHESLREDGKDVSEDMASAPENETLKNNRGAFNEKALSPLSVSSSMNNPQLGGLQTSNPVVKKRK